jgi:type III pantothenate kinase
MATDLIALDVGNSRIGCALFRNGILVENWFCHTTDARKAADTILEKTETKVPVAISSVVPAATEILQAHLEPEGRSLTVIKNQSIIKGVYPGMGSDRVANAIAAWRLYGQQHPVAVIDLGTATTLTAVTPDGTFKGGFITLGIGRTLAAIHNEAAQLPYVTFEPRRAHPTQLSLDTETSIASGSLAAHIGTMEYWVRVARRTLGGDTVTLATGGWSTTIARYTRVLDFVDTNLTLKGIYLMAEAALDLAGPS